MVTYVVRRADGKLLGFLSRKAANWVSEYPDAAVYWTPAEAFVARKLAGEGEVVRNYGFQDETVVTR